jgi:YbbR domain-containing protein
MLRKNSIAIRVVCFLAVMLALFVATNTNQSTKAHTTTLHRTEKARRSEPRHVVIWYYTNSGYRMRVGTYTETCDGTITRTGQVTSFEYTVVDESCDPPFFP